MTTLHHRDSARPPAPSPKPRWMKPYTPRWRLLAYETMLRGDVKPCRDCGGPVLIGYCCNRCGSVEP